MPSRTARSTTRRRVSLRPRPRAPSIPERFELRLRVRAEHRRVTCDGGRLRFECAGRSASETRTFRPSPLEWERFRQALDRLGVWQWADGFERGGNGESNGEPTWSLELAWAGRRLRTAGFDAYPPLAEGPDVTPVFAGFCAAVSRLVGDRLEAAR
jgi:hypothetical protein